MKLYLSRSRKTRRPANGRRCGAAVAAAVATLAVAGPASAAPRSAPDCEGQLIERPFAALGDQRDYVLAPGGAFERADGDGWLLEDGARIVAANAPVDVRGLSDRSSLHLPPGARATSPTMCVDLRFPTFRFFARALGEPDEELQVEVRFPDAEKPKWHEVRDLEADGNAWGLTKDLKLNPSRGGKAAGGRRVAFRLTSDDDADWQVDNLYVDPRFRG